MSRPSDWQVLDLPRDPTPGDPVTVGALARRVHLVADDAERCQRDVKGLAGDGAVTSWIGAAGEAFRRALEDFPSQLGKLADSYGQAARAIGTYGRELDTAQDQADRALAQGRAAQADLDTLGSQLASAHVVATSAGSTVARLSAPLPAGAEPPDPDQVRSATRNAQAANDRVRSLSSSLGGANDRLDAAERLARQAQELRERAADRATADLHDASDAGIEPNSFWDDFTSAAGKVWTATIKIATVVAIVLAVVALFVGGPLVWGLLAAASLLLLTDSLAKYANGQGSLWEVGLNLLGVVPGGRLLTALGKAAGLTRIGTQGVAVGARSMSAAKASLSGTASALRRGIGPRMASVAGDSGYSSGVPSVLRPYLARVDELGVATRPDAANFYSGGGGAARETAGQYATRTATTTLERTPGGSWLDERRLFDEDSPLDPTEAFELWSRTSTRYADEASGNVRAFVHDPNPQGVWNTFELPGSSARARRRTHHQCHHRGSRHRRTQGPHARQADRPRSFMMGLVRVKPQRVEHTDGWAVASAGRDRIKYEEGGRTALIGIDRGQRSSRLYVDSLSWVDGDDETPVPEPHRAAVLDRIVEGLTAMGTGAIEVRTVEALSREPTETSHPMRTLQPAAHGKPYALLEPIAQALLARGAVLTREGDDGSPFGPSPEGYIAVIDQPIDWAWIRASFELPVVVRYDAERDAVVDDEHWTAIYGSAGSLALS